MEKVIAINYLCVYSVIEMVLRDIGETDWDQIQLANRLGVVLPEGESIKNVDNVTYSADERKWGVHINIEELNSFFSRENIPLCAFYLDANPFDCYDQAELDEEKRYVLYLYSYGSLNAEPEKINVGHASIKMNNIKNGIVSIYDPGPFNAGVKDVRLTRLYDAIGDCDGGILILERTNNE